MASYTFHRLTAAGLPERGMLRLASGDPVTAMEYLERDGSVVLKVTPVPALFRFWARLSVYGFQGVSRTETAQCLETLAAYLASGIALADALGDLRTQTRGPELRQVLGHLLVDVRSGVALSRAMARHEHIFSPVTTTMVGVGEEVGELPTQIRAAAEHLRHMEEIARLARRTLVYPVITLSVLMGVLLFWVLMVVPALAGTFEDLGRDLPGSMRFMLRVSAVLHEHGLVLAMALGLTVPLLWLTVKKSTLVRGWRDKLAIRLPFVGPVVAQAAAARALELLGVLLGNGVAPDKSLDLTCKATHNAHYRDILKRARRLISGGVPLSTALARSKGFDDAAVRLLHAGERTGRLKEQCEAAAAEYRRRLSHSVQMLSKMVEPILLVLLTLLLAFFILGFLAPIYQTLGGM
ncbi:type II secretion system F family protein [Desulfonatronum thioautotrophicum]|uniref:type II secretion system F family protein n=1 Tax=Desulfonatronum thioautotrophicum TaxID=617001 RepID=UPI0005EB85E1|nr:type II secretion system F family protein [Desulfonatronum thioautotrophicum]